MQSYMGAQFQHLILETALYIAYSWSHRQEETLQCLKKKEQIGTYVTKT